MENVRRIRTPPAPPWSGRDKVDEAIARLDARDLDGAVAALAEAIGPDVRDWTDEERPFVAAASLLLAGVLDEMGEARAAVQVYARTFELFGGDDQLVNAHGWLGESMEGARRRYEWLREQTPKDEREQV